MHRASMLSVDSIIGSNNLNVGNIQARMILFVFAFLSLEGKLRFMTIYSGVWFMA